MTKSEDRPKVWSYLPAEIHEYFFRKIFAGERGIKQELIIQFFEALYYECKHRGIKPEWNTESAKCIEQIMSNLNFNRSPSSRRSTHPPTKRKEKSHTAPDDGRATDGVSD